ncbi:MAG: peptide chain release factor 1 [Candidatus Margulisiibacteriota bacterium]
MVKKYLEIENRYAETEKSMSEQTGNQEIYRELAKKYSELSKPVALFRRYKKVKTDLADAESILKDQTADAELKEMAQTEQSNLALEVIKLEEDLRFLLIPQDPNDNKDCYLEIRAGTGGDEASIFAGDLMNMYSRYIEKRGWKKELLECTPSEVGGFKEIIVLIKGDGPYGWMKYEAGTHRVQRVPETEASGRIHTSAATVAVLPEAEDIELEVRTEDLRIDTYRASGAGGQHINKTDSAVRITHLPTGVVVSCQDGRSQHKNKETAMRLLKSKLLESQREAQEAQTISSRRIQVGSGDRSEKIRTYNYPQGRLTDHRIGFTTYNLQGFLDGNIDELLDALLAADKAEKLARA